MKVGVEILTGGFFYVEVEADATVEKLKQEIAIKESLQAQRMVLVDNNGRLIRDGQCRLEDSGVSDGSIVYLFFSCTGERSWLTYFEDYVTFLIKEP